MNDTEPCQSSEPSAIFDDITLAQEDTRLLLYGLFKVIQHDLATPIVVLQDVLDQGRASMLSEEEWRSGMESLERIRHLVRDSGIRRLVGDPRILRPAAALEKVPI